MADITPKTDPGKIWVARELARCADMDSHQAVEKVWDKMLKGEIGTTVNAGKQCVKTCGASGEETEGEKVMRLWRLRGLDVETIR